MNAHTLKIAISSILYVADEDIAKLNALCPEGGIEHKASYYNDLAQIACHVGDSMDAVQELLTLYASDIANTEDVFANIDISALSERISNAFKAASERFHERIHAVCSELDFDTQSEDNERKINHETSDD